MGRASRQRPCISGPTIAASNMFGYSGYGTNAYGTKRASGFFAPMIRLFMRVVKSTYGISEGLMLRFRTSTLTNPDKTITTTLKL